MKKALYSFAVIVSVAFIFSACASQGREGKMLTEKDLPDFKLGTLPAQRVTRMHHDLKVAPLHIVFSPSNDFVIIKHKLLGDKIWICLSKENREALRNAIETYLSAYENHTLNMADSEKKGFFGQSKTLLLWGVSAVTHRASPTLRFEYDVISKRPYFVLATKTVSSTSKNGAYNAPAIRLALSPAQCTKLMKVVEEDVLDSIVRAKLKEYNQFDVPADGDGTSTTDTDNNQLEDFPEEEAQPLNRF